jgi:hypothetical protein
MTALPLSMAPIPNATVLAAPAASAAQVAAAAGAAASPLLGLAPAGTLLPAQPAAPAGDGTPLDVPEEFRARLDGAVSEGRVDAREFAATHPRSERWMVVDWAMLQMKWPPKSDTEELAYLHKVAEGRTAAGVERAKFWSKHGLVDEWERMLDPYDKRVGPAQAKRARKLLRDTLMVMNTITQTAKAGAARQRPFVVDPTLELAVDKPGNNPSYPSGHTTAAFAAALVLSHLMPDRRAEFMGLAREASWARVYSGVHFPSDVLAGAKLATTVASYLTSVSGTRPVRGTAASVNPGVAGGRRALAGAAKLSGPPIA